MLMSETVCSWYDELLQEGLGDCLIFHEISKGQYEVISMYTVGAVNHKGKVRIPDALEPLNLRDDERRVVILI